MCACWERGPTHPKGAMKGLAIEGSTYDMAELLEDIDKADFVIAHNAKFEAKWLKRCGIDLTKLVTWCTQLGEYVIAGNRPWGLHLADCAERRNLGYKDVVGGWIRNGVKTRDIPYHWLEHYCHQDVNLCTKVFLDQRRDIIRRKLMPVTFTRNLSVPVLADIEGNGMCLDEDRVMPIFFDYQERYQAVEAELNAITGGINFNSPKQVAEYLYDTLGFAELVDKKGKPKRTPAGGRKADKLTLEEVLKHATSEDQREFVRLKGIAGKLSHALSNALGKFKQCCEDTEDKILYADFNQTRTATHRTSSTGKRYAAQFQNFNRDFKPVFRARHAGWAFAEHDQAQLEFKVAVDLGSDANGLEDIQNKVDAHAFTASVIFREEWKKVGDKIGDAVRDACRTAAKPHTFKPLYGGEFGTPEEMAYYAAFRERYAGIASAQSAWKQHVANHKYLRTKTGLIFYWPHASIQTWSGQLSPRVQHQICNYNVQSYATAEIVPVSLVYMWHRLKWLEVESFIVSTVHDSVLGEVKPTEKEVYDKVAVIAFENDTIKYLKKVYKQNFMVPLVADSDYGTHWHTSKQWEEKFLPQGESCEPIIGRTNVG